MAARQIKATKKVAPAGRNTLARKPTGKPNAVAAARKTPAQKAANKLKAATSAPKPASMTGPLPAIVTLKHLGRVAGYNHGVSKKQATDMLTGFVTDIGRALKKVARSAFPTSASSKCAFVPHARRVRGVIPRRAKKSDRAGSDLISLPDQLHEHKMPLSYSVQVQSSAVERSSRAFGSLKKTFLPSRRSDDG